MKYTQLIQLIVKQANVLFGRELGQVQILFSFIGKSPVISCCLIIIAGKGILIDLDLWLCAGSTTCIDALFHCSLIGGASFCCPCCSSLSIWIDHILDQI